MPRKVKKEMIDVNKCRAEWYALHFETRQEALTHPKRIVIASSVATLPKPELTIFGAAGFNGKSMFHYFSNTVEMGGYYVLSRSLTPWVDVSCLFWWYWSDAGWEAFEKLWQNLPEVVHMDVCTNGKVIHIGTQVEYCNPAGQP